MRRSDEVLMREGRVAVSPIRCLGPRGEELRVWKWYLWCM